MENVRAPRRKGEPTSQSAFDSQSYAARTLPLIDQLIGDGFQHDEGFSLVLMDVDDFRPMRESVEDSEWILAEIVALLKERFEDDLLLQRCGPDEFLAVLPRTETSEAIVWGEEARQLIESHAFRYAPAKVTVSVGVSSYPSDAKDAGELLRMAEEAVYLAKRRGRNRVSLPPREKLILKSNYYTSVQLEKLGELASQLGRTEASLLREALDDLLRKSDV